MNYIERGWEMWQTVYFVTPVVKYKNKKVILVIAKFSIMTAKYLSVKIDIQ